MKKPGLVLLLSSVIVFLLTSVAHPQYTIKKINDNHSLGSYYLPPEINDSGYVVWQGWDDSDSEIFLYDGTNTTQLTNNDYDDAWPQMNDNGWVVWQGCAGYEGSDCEIFLYDGTNTTNISNNDYYDEAPQINDNGYVVWVGSDGSDYEIFLYDGTSTTQLTHNDYDDASPQINDSGYVVWSGYDGSDLEIFLYDGTNTTQLTHNDYYDASPQINDNGWVVWMGGYGDIHRTLTLFLAVPCSLNDDNDGDGYVSRACGGDDCDDFNPDVNPGMTETPGNGIDDDCDPATPAYPQPANTVAASYGRNSLVGSGVFNELALLLIPVGAVTLLKRLRRNR